MKIIDKIILVIFSIIILIEAIILCFLLFGWITMPTITLLVEKMLADGLASKIGLGIGIVLILCAVKGVFFTSSGKEAKGYKEGILLENEDGKLLISKDTIESLVNGVVNGFESTENVTTKVGIDRENNLTIYVNLQVASNTVIKDLSANMQARIKEVIKTSSDLDVKEVNIRIRNIASPKETVQE